MESHIGFPCPRCKRSLATRDVVFQSETERMETFKCLYCGYMVTRTLVAEKLRDVPEETLWVLKDDE